MEPIEYVREEHNNRAIDIEKAFKNLSPIAGVLFISVKAVPSLDNSVSKFRLCLGIKKELQEATGIALIKHVVLDKLNLDLTLFSYEVHRGI